MKWWCDADNGDENKMKKKVWKRKERKDRIKNKAKLYTKEQEERQEDTTAAASSQAPDTRHTQRGSTARGRSP